MKVYFEQLRSMIEDTNSSIDPRKKRNTISNQESYADIKNALNNESEKLILRLECLADSIDLMHVEMATKKICPTVCELRCVHAESDKICDNLSKFHLRIEEAAPVLKG
jgi:hypothetical protein